MIVVAKVGTSSLTDETGEVVAEPLLKLWKSFAICRLGKTLLEIDFFEQFPRPLNSNCRSLLRPARRCNVSAGENRRGGFGIHDGRAA